MLEKNKIYLGDCLDVMKEIDDQSIDMILCDLPYGTTQCKWDTIIPFEQLWNQYERIIKSCGAIVLTAIQPFASQLISSNLQFFRYEWIWKKSNSPNYPQAKNMPLKKHENILVFSNGKIGHVSQLGSKRMNYFPQGLIECDEKVKGNRGKQNEDLYVRPSQNKVYTKRQKNYPQTILEFDYDYGEQIHPTQKPVALFEYLISTYTLENELILDNCIGSGTTAIAAANTKRNFIGIEKDEKYWLIANKRLQECGGIID